MTDTYLLASLPSPWDKDYADVIDIRDRARERQTERARRHNDAKLAARAAAMAQVANWDFGISL
jgi:hypothetical protein